MFCYYLPMLLMNFQIKFLNLLVMYVSAIQFSIYAVNFIVKFQTIASLLQGILIWATL